MSSEWAWKSKTILSLSVSLSLERALRHIFWSSPFLPSCWACFVSDYFHLTADDDAAAAADNAPYERTGPDWTENSWIRLSFFYFIELSVCCVSNKQNELSEKLCICHFYLSLALSCLFSCLFSTTKRRHESIVRVVVYRSWWLRPLISPIVHILKTTEDLFCFWKKMLLVWVLAFTCGRQYMYIVFLLNDFPILNGKKHDDGQ